jgi:hypothetical protein
MTRDRDWRAYQLEWQVYGEYRLDKGPPERSPVYVGGFGTGPAPLYKRDSNLVIRRTSEELARPQPNLFNACGVLRIFAECKTPNDALKFVQAWGFLRRRDAEYEYVSDILGEAEIARVLLKGAEKQNWPELAGALARHQGSIATLGVQLSIEPAAQHPLLWLRPADLFQGMQIQFLDELCRAADLARCGLPTCRKFFERGPGKHRTTAHYCDSSCKDKHVYMKRTQKLREARS